MSVPCPKCDYRVHDTVELALLSCVGIADVLLTQLAGRDSDVLRSMLESHGYTLDADTDDWRRELRG